MTCDGKGVLPRSNKIVIPYGTIVQLDAASAATVTKAFK